LVEEQTPDAILTIVGANDRQAIRTESGSLAPGTDEWRTAYALRVAGFADALKATGKAILWVGLVPVSSSPMSRDYSAFNGIVREQVESKGLRFIDTWNGFADEEGNYVAVGPDVRGQTVQLRASDGLNFTRAGQRKLAFFVEQQLKEILGGATPELAAISPTMGTVEPGGPTPQIGPMVPLEALSAAGGEALSGSPGTEEEDAQVTATTSPEGDGEEHVAPEGRVDDYRWPPPPAASASAPAAASSPGRAAAN
jgi:hypothetical protein